MASDTRLGRDLAGYRIEGVLGRGGMGVVYRGLDPELERQVAIKSSLPSSRVIFASGSASTPR